MAVVECLGCGHDIFFETALREAQLIRCQNCGAELEVISEDPLEVDWVYLEPVGLEEESDWN